MSHSSPHSFPYPFLLCAVLVSASPILPSAHYDKPLTIASFLICLGLLLSGELTLTLRIRNRYNEKPIDLLPRPDPSADPQSDDEQVRAALRKAEAESMVADKGDVVQGEWMSPERSEGVEEPRTGEQRGEVRTGKADEASLREARVCA